MFCTLSATAVYFILKLNEITRALTESTETMVVSVAAVSRAFLNKLPADLRQIVIEEGRNIQPKMMAQSRIIDEAMRKKWTEMGGEWIRFSLEDQNRMNQLLGGIGDEVTKDNPQVNAFYRRLAAVSQKYKE
jgi:TRAP-type C4-dicarboxylate transport system substrate-binding protein